MRISDWSADVCFSDLGAQVLSDGLGLLRAGMRPVPKPQPAEGVTYAHKLDKDEAKLDWSQPATVLANKVRAFNPWPLAEAQVARARLRIQAARALPRESDAAPGTRLAVGRGGPEWAWPDSAQ